MSNTPFPPPPEPGWYDDDVTVLSELNDGTNVSALSEEAAPQVRSNVVREAVVDAPVEETAPEPAPATAESQAMSQAAVNGADNGGASASPAVNASGDIEDWDGTVLSSSFMDKSPKKGYHLHNDATGQDIIIDRSTLLGRHVSATIPEGAVSVKLTDPTRTVSRNHAAISFDKDGTLWIEDYGSLNGTYVIEGDHEKQIKGKPMQLTVPSTLRIGDQFFKLTE